MVTVEEFKKSLKEGIVSFSFTKKDGTIRKMNATLKADLLPVVDKHVTTQPVNLDPFFIKVYDVDAQGWRSFHFDQLIHEKNAQEE